MLLCMFVMVKTNKIKVNDGQINEIKYPRRNNHESLVDFIQPDANAMITRGIARIANTDEPTRRFFSLVNFFF